MKSQLQPPNEKSRSDLPDATHNPSKNGKETIEGLDIIWMRDNQFCIKFQTGNCSFPTDHDTIATKVTLKHACAGCEFLNKPLDNTHSAKNCPSHSQFFRL